MNLDYYQDMEEVEDLNQKNVEDFKRGRGRPRVTEAEKKLAMKRAQKRYYEKNRLKISEYAREKYYLNREERLEKQKEYQKNKKKI